MLTVGSHVRVLPDGPTGVIQKVLVDPMRYELLGNDGTHLTAAAGHVTAAAVFVVVEHLAGREPRVYDIRPDSDLTDVLDRVEMLRHAAVDYGRPEDQYWPAELRRTGPGTSSDSRKALDEALALAAPQAGRKVRTAIVQLQAALAEVDATNNQMGGSR